MPGQQQQQQQQQDVSQLNIGQQFQVPRQQQCAYLQGQAPGNQGAGSHAVSESVSRSASRGSISVELEGGLVEDLEGEAVCVCVCVCVCRWFVAGSESRGSIRSTRGRPGGKCPC